jgi:hypothetical protein
VAKGRYPIGKGIRLAGVRHPDRCRLYLSLAAMPGYNPLTQACVMPGEKEAKGRML